MRKGKPNNKDLDILQELFGAFNCPKPNTKSFPNWAPLPPPPPPSTVKTIKDEIKEAIKEVFNDPDFIDQLQWRLALAANKPNPNDSKHGKSTNR